MSETTATQHEPGTESQAQTQANAEESAKVGTEPEAIEAAPAAAPAMPTVTPWQDHPSPYAGIVLWAEGEFARLEAMIRKDAPAVEAEVATIETDLGTSTMGTSVTPPVMGSKE